MHGRKLLLLNSRRRKFPETATPDDTNSAAIARYERNDRKWTRITIMLFVATVIVVVVIGAASKSLPTQISALPVLLFQILRWSKNNQLKAQHMWHIHTSLVSVFLPHATNDQKNVTMVAVKRATEQHVLRDRIIGKVLEEYKGKMAA